MMVNVQLFAAARDRLGRRVVQLELEERATVGELRSRLSVDFPQLAPIVSRSLIAVDAEYAGDDFPLGPTSQVALIPPVSGG